MSNSNTTMTVVLSEEERAISIYNSYTKEQIGIIKQTAAKGATDLELAWFLTICAKKGLDPLSGQIHFVKRRDANSESGASVTFQTGIDGYRLIADRTQRYAGNDDYLYDDGKTVHELIALGKTKPETATATVWKIVAGVRVPFTRSVSWINYYPGDGKAGFMWRKIPWTMLGKCAEAAALRAAFPNDLSGIYVNEELQKADAIETTDLSEPAATRSDSVAAQLEAKTETIQEAVVVDDSVLADVEEPPKKKTKKKKKAAEPTITKDQQSAINGLCVELHWGVEAVTTLATKTFGEEKILSKLTAAEADKLIAKMEEVAGSKNNDVLNSEPAIKKKAAEQPDEADTITVAQMADLYEIGERKGFDKNGVHEFIRSKFDIESESLLSQSQYIVVRSALNKKRNVA